MQIESTVAMNAISKTALEENEMKMTKEEFGREDRYQSCMYFLKKMLHKGLVTDDEFIQAEYILREKYKPITSYLISCNDLICAGSRALIDNTERG